MTPRPLPLAPRPYPGEALSSWAGRVAARYDLTADKMVRCMADDRSLGHGHTRWLDYRADPGLEAFWAAVARICPAELRALRIVPGDGSTSCWHRTGSAWCPACIQEDLARRGEAYERASWRLGCSVICVRHGEPIRDLCRRCWPDTPGGFRHDEGRMRLLCRQCGKLPDPPEGEEPLEDRSHLGPFLTVTTPELTRLLAALQGDLTAALAGATTCRPWGRSRSAAGLDRVVAGLVSSTIVGTDMRVEPRLDLHALLACKPRVAVCERDTLAMVPARCARGLLTVIAAVLDSLDGGRGGHRWVQGEATSELDAEAFVIWIGAGGRRWLASMLPHWEPAASAAFAAVLARVVCCSA